MSEEKTPSPDEPKNTARKGTIIALFAGVLGLVAGAGLYALSGGNGNIAGGGNAFGMADSVKHVAGENAGPCALDEALRARIDKVATGELAAFKALDRPYSVSALPFNDKDGAPKTLADWQGRTVLMNLWATWCAPCRAEMPALDALQKELGSADFEVVPVSVDLGEDTKPKKFFADMGLKHMSFYHDPDLATLNTLKKDGLAFGLPATVLVSTKGCVLGMLNGPAEWASEDAKKLIKSVLAPVDS